MRCVGVLGGMGPAATIDFMAKVLRHSQAARGAGSREQDDVRLLVDSNPAVPDRNAAVAGTGASPAPVLAAMAVGLARAGADFLVMPCNAAHAFADAIRGATDLPFISIVDETVRAMRAHAGVRRVGILAVEATARARLYEQALAPHGIVALTPDGAARARFMALVWRIKAGEVGADVRAAMRDAATALQAAGADLIVAGCTEVPLVLGADDLAVPLLDPTEILARQTVAYARGAPLPPA